MAVVAILVAIHLLMRRSHTTLVRSLIARMDELVARYTTTLWSHRDEIYQYEENVWLLWSHRDEIYQYEENVWLFFRTMQKMLSDPKASYHEYRDRWAEDIEYASSLLPEAIDLPDIEHIRETDESLGRIERLYNTRGVLVTVATAGLYLLWKQPLYKA